MLRRLQQMGIGIIMTTHFPDQVLHVADCAAILAEGKIQVVGPPEDVITAENLTVYTISPSPSMMSLKPIKKYACLLRP